MSLDDDVVFIRYIPPPGDSEVTVYFFPRDNVSDYEDILDETEGTSDISSFPMVEPSDDEDPIWDDMWEDIDTDSDDEDFNIAQAA